jgi:chaperone required for assembly of F1-ATPase
MKRFYTSAEAVPDEGGWSIHLDDKAVRTPGRTPLIVPSGALAQAIVQEWADQGEEIDPRTMPLTGFANATIDHVLPGLADFRRQMTAYGASDLFYYRADETEGLFALQAAAWDPLLDWASAHYGIVFAVTNGIMPVDQPDLSLVRLAAVVDALDPWLLAGAATVTQIAGTLIGTLAHLEDRIEAEALFDATTIDERWQAEQWGEDEEATELMAARRAELLGATRYCGLVRAR